MTTARSRVILSATTSAVTLGRACPARLATTEPAAAPSPAATTPQKPTGSGWRMEPACPFLNAERPEASIPPESARPMLQRARFPAGLAALAMLPGIVCAQALGGDVAGRPGAHVEKRIEGTAPDAVRLTLPANQFVRIEVIQSGADLAVTLRDPQGRALIEADSANGRYG